MEQGRLQGYMSVMGNHDPDRLIQSVGELCKEMQYFPRPADIIKRAKRIGRREYMGREMLPEPSSHGGPVSDGDVRALVDNFALTIGLHRMADDSLKTLAQMTDDERDAVGRGAR